MPWRLLFRNLRAHPVRTSLTVGSCVVAIFLVVVLRSVLQSMRAGVAASAQTRLIVQSAVSLFVDLPVSYEPKIVSVPGVARAMKMQWFGGIYRTPSNFFAQFAVDHDRLLSTYPEIQLVEGTEAAFAAKRTGCVVGRKLARRFGWKLGSRVPLIGTIFPRTDGGPWELEVTGIYRSTAANVDESTLWFHFDYLDEALEAGAATGPRGSGIFVLGLQPGADPVRVSRLVDELFENGPQRVQTTTEAEFQRQFVTMVGSVPRFLGSIGGGVLFAIVLAVLNAMLMAFRQRTRELGVLKALGFSDGTAFSLYLLEAMLICCGGGAIGVAAAVLSAPALAQALGAVLPLYEVSLQTIGLGMAVATVVGLVAGLAPALLARRLVAVDALGKD